MAWEELNREDIHLGEPVPFDVVDGEGRVIVRQDMVLRTPRQVERLFAKSREVFIADPEETRKAETHNILSPFKQISIITGSLPNIFDKQIKTRVENRKPLAEALPKVVGALVALCEYDLDAVLGFVQLSDRLPYSIRHPVYTAVLCYLVARNLNLPERNMHALVGAALTANIGMFRYHDALQAQRGPLNEKQREEVQQHPLVSAVILKHNGIRDKLWLEIVMQHHERVDGSGYPRHLKGNAFITEARILAMADRYHAMVSSRKYRKGMLPTNALKKMFTDQEKELDHNLALLFIKAVSVFPPGTFVRLRNGEAAVVARSGKESMKPLVKAVADVRGNFYKTPITRETDREEFEILNTIETPPREMYDYDAIWDYSLVLPKTQKKSD